MSELIIRATSDDISTFVKTGDVSDVRVKAVLASSRKYRVLATLDITYRLPDHLDIVQRLLHQIVDEFPHFPEVRGFLGFWKETLEGPIKEVSIAHVPYGHGRTIKSTGHYITLH